MKALVDVPAPAKLNLFLHVTGQRADGYHLLQSVFMLIDWCDTLHFEARADGQIFRHDVGPALPADDLIVRAARLLQQRSATALGADIHVDKRIPSQAGMGGGSSDAASTLLALNRLWGLGYTRLQLAQLGLQLGADVPFFVHGANAWVEGIGERITPIALPAQRFWVVKPQSGVDTASIFRHPQLERCTKPATIADFAAAPFDFGRNDLQAVVSLLCPDVPKAIALLERQGCAARMTGSGSAVFAPCSMPGLDMHTRPAMIQVPDQWIVRQCSNLEAHPLQGWATSDD